MSEQCGLHQTARRSCFDRAALQPEQLRELAAAGPGPRHGVRLAAHCAAVAADARAALRVHRTADPSLQRASARTELAGCLRSCARAAWLLASAGGEPRDSGAWAVREVATAGALLAGALCDSESWPASATHGPGLWAVEAAAASATAAAA